MCSGVCVLLSLFTIPPSFPPSPHHHHQQQQQPVRVIMQLRSGHNPTGPEAIQALLHHLDLLYPKLEVRPSTIPNAGMGLFTTIDLPANQPIVLYYGELTTRAQGGYCISVSQKHKLDGKPVVEVTRHDNNGDGDDVGVVVMVNKGRCVNDARKNTVSLKNNMRYGPLLLASEVNSSHPCVVMSSTRRIKAGEELLASYGMAYWKDWDANEDEGRE